MNKQKIDLITKEINLQYRKNDEIKTRIEAHKINIENLLYEAEISDLLIEKLEDIKTK